MNLYREVRSAKISKSSRSVSPKSCCITSTIPHVHITNTDWVLCHRWDFDTNDLIINFHAGRRHSIGRISNKAYSIQLDDGYCSYRHFRNIINFVVQQAKLVGECGNVYISCDGGVNRSVAIALGYLLAKGVFSSVEDGIKAIEEAKCDYPGWDTLTNKLFRDYLSAYLGTISSGE